MMGVTEHQAGQMSLSLDSYISLIFTGKRVWLLLDWSISDVTCVPLAWILSSAQSPAATG